MNIIIKDIKLSFYQGVIESGVPRVNKTFSLGMEKN